VVHTGDALHRTVRRDSQFNGSPGMTNLDLLQQIANCGWELIWQVCQGGFAFLRRDSLFAHS
jgi:hypothetical protein